MLDYPTPDIIEPRPLTVTGVKNRDDAVTTTPSSSVDVTMYARTSGVIEITVPGKSGYAVRVTDCAGRIVHARSHIDVSSYRVALPRSRGTGVYFVSVEHARMHVTGKVVVR
jgi:hypothetical protein